jgi:outer membrane protein assembly factor BamD
MSQALLWRRLSPRFPLFLLLIGPFIAGCSDTPKDLYVERPVETLYNIAMDDLADENYAKAAKEFDEVERQHPYSVWASKAQLMAAYSHYEHNKFDDAIGALDRFIQLHPSHKDVAYAYYLKAICYYEQIADVERDQKATEQSLKFLQEVVDRFPTSRYAKDAKLKLDLTRDHLAGKEMAIGRYYQRQHMYLAAVNRYRRVIDNFQTTTHVPEALERLTETYTALGLTDEAQKIGAVLGYNYPGNEWYLDSYTLIEGRDAPGAEKSNGWFDWIW